MELQATHLELSYGSRAAVQDVTLRIPTGAVTSIIGPNGCGKSTLLRALARLHPPRQGAVLLDGQIIHRMPTKAVARKLSLLAQQSETPGSLTVEDLARRGRYPHQALLQPPTEGDQAAVERALERVGMTDLRARPVDELSGGQRQRAWIAMALAQETPILLLDEPTTYLDIAHQQEILALIRRLNREEGRTIVLVLHDINDAMQVSDHLVVMQDGSVRAEGAPGAVLTPALLAEVFGMACDVLREPGCETPVFVPRGRAVADDRPIQMEMPPALRADALSLGYHQARVVRDVSVSLPAGQVTAVVGPNGSGKSTLLRAFARLLEPQSGSALLMEQPVSQGSHRAFAQRLAVQLQGAVAPEGLLVEDLVAAGRHPYQRWYRQWSAEDEQVVEHALRAAGIQDLRLRPMDTLSGGQQQRAWLAMALAQQTPVLLMDEPTTFLDVSYQIEVLDWLWALNREEGRTVGLVLHDLGLACRYADIIIVMKDGRIAARGAPAEVISPELVREVFGLDCRVTPDPRTGRPLILPEREREIPLPAAFARPPREQRIAPVYQQVR